MYTGHMQHCSFTILLKAKLTANVFLPVVIPNRHEIPHHLVHHVEPRQTTHTHSQTYLQHTDHSHTTNFSYT